MPLVVAMSFMVSGFLLCVLVEADGRSWPLDLIGKLLLKVILPLLPLLLKVLLSWNPLLCKRGMLSIKKLLPIMLMSKVMTVMMLVRVLVLVKLVMLKRMMRRHGYRKSITIEILISTLLMMRKLKVFVAILLSLLLVKLLLALRFQKLVFFLL